MLRHLVLMRLTDPADAAETVTRLQALSGRIPTLLSLEAGVNVREHADAWHVALVTTHEDLAGLSAYQEHPAHQEFLDWCRPRLAARAVVDHL